MDDAHFRCIMHYHLVYFRQLVCTWGYTKKVHLSLMSVQMFHMHLVKSQKRIDRDSSRFTRNASVGGHVDTALQQMATLMSSPPLTTWTICAAIFPSAIMLTSIGLLFGSIVGYDCRFKVGGMTHILTCFPLCNDDIFTLCLLRYDD